MCINIYIVFMYKDYISVYIYICMRQGNSETKISSLEVEAAGMPRELSFLINRSTYSAQSHAALQREDLHPEP